MTETDALRAPIVPHSFDLFYITMDLWLRAGVSLNAEHSFRRGTFEAALRYAATFPGWSGGAAALDELLAWIRTAAPLHYPEFSEAAFRRTLRAGPNDLFQTCHAVDDIMAMNRAVDKQALPGVELYTRTTCPVLLVAATKGLYNRATVVDVQAFAPHLQIEWVACGHTVQQERPDDLARLITSFVGSL